MKIADLQPPYRLRVVNWKHRRVEWINVTTMAGSFAIGYVDGQQRNIAGDRRVMSDGPGCYAVINRAPLR